MELTFSFLILIAGLVLLGFGAHYLVDGSARLARKIGISMLLVGLTVIAFGTSVPEIIIAIMASAQTSPKIAVGNAIGSSIANIGFVLAITALIRPLTIHSKLLKKELPLLFIVMILVGIILFKHRLEPVDGMLLLLGAVVMIAWFIRQGIKTKATKESLAMEYRKEILQRKITPKISNFKIGLKIILGICLLPIGAQMIIKSAISLADIFHISQLVISLTIISIGSTLPELATSLTSTLKKEDDIVLGNVIGSNIFNCLAVLAIPAILHPVLLNKTIFYRDYLTLLTLTTLLYIFVFIQNKRTNKFSRIEAVFLLILYATYFAISYCCT